MGFVNERISASNMEKYKIKEIDQKIGINRRVNSRFWTIDSERNIYLRCVGMGREETCNETQWTFLWNEYLIFVDIESVHSGGQRNAPGWSTKRIKRIFLMGGNSNHLPPALAEKREQILGDLYDALLAYKDGGIYSSTTTYELKLEVADGA